MRPSIAHGLLGIALLLACTTEEGAFPGCPVKGDAARSGVRTLNQLKNRVAAPSAPDIDSAVTIEAMLAPGDDRGRWSERRAAPAGGSAGQGQRGGRETV